MLWLWTSLAMAGCPEDPDGVVVSATAAIEVAFVHVDDQAFGEAVEHLREALPCSQETYDREDALFLHRAYALMSFVSGDRTRTQRSFRALRRLDPSWVPPEALIPPGHPLTAIWENSQPIPGAEPVRLELAPDGGWLVDGRVRDAVPIDAGFLLQGLDDDGGVLLTGYYTSPSEIPLADIRAFAALPSRVASPERKRARVIGSVASGAVLLGGSAVLGLAAHQASTLSDVDVDQVPLVEQRVQTFSTVGGILLGVGGAGAIVTWAVPW
ncbi:MAG: hypothetical protein ACJAZO_001832 [Myxococcota bacterium]|jgi:hypothetical protein